MSVTLRSAPALLVALALVGCGGGSSSAPAGGQTAPAPGQAPGAANADAGGTKGEIAATVRRYDKAYRHRDVGTLSATLTDTIQRQGPGPGGCITSIGKPNVINDINGQFSRGAHADPM